MGLAARKAGGGKRWEEWVSNIGFIKGKVGQKEVKSGVTGRKVVSMCFLLIVLQ